jgi:hypothetical protein
MHEANDKNEVDYKSLKLAIENSKLNVRNMTKFKKEYNFKNNISKKSKGLIGSKNNQNKQSFSTKLKFNMHNNTHKRFDFRKTVIMESNKGKKLPAVIPPVKGCLKKTK